MTKGILGLFSGALAMMAVTVGSVPAHAKDFYRLSATAPGSSPYLVLSTFANIINGSFPDIEIQVNATGAATRHQLLAGRNEVDFYMTSPTIFRFMRQGKAMYKNVKDAPEAAKNLRLMLGFPIGSYHVVAYADSGITELGDLKGKKVFLGPPGGGALSIATRMVEGATGLKASQDFELVRLGWDAATQAFQDRRLDVYANPTLAPSPVISQIAFTSKIRLLGLTAEQLAKKPVKDLASRKGGTIDTIAPRTYGENQVNEESVQTLGSLVGIGTRAALSDDLVYKVTKKFWDSLKDAEKGKPWLRQLKLEDNLKEMNMPLHPGALRYYKEIGLHIPSDLM